MRGILLVSTLLAFGVVFVSCSAGEAAKGGGKARASGPVFDHQAHLEKGVECSHCHGEADAAFQAMPALATCLECHEEIDGEKPAEKKAAAFYDAEGQGRWAHVTDVGEEVIFDHAKHAGRNADCLACHGDLAASSELLSSHRISMDECIACHRESAAGSRYLDCESCHREIGTSRPPPSHQVGWTQRHGLEIADRHLEAFPQDCALCHRKSDCDECHRTEKPRNHNNLWRLHGHAAAASIDRQACQTCHQTDACAECHQHDEPRSHRGAFGAPFNRHCYGCHLPVSRAGDEGCGVCHQATPGHDAAPPRPATPSHATNNPSDCRTCHVPMPHPDNGQSCLLCHR